MPDQPEPAPTLGILSDTHGDATTAAAGIARLIDAGVSVLLHLGDVGSEAVLEELVAFDRGEVHLVFGNCDDEVRLGRHAERLGLRHHHPAGVIEIAERRIGFTHGHLIDLGSPQVVERFLVRLVGAVAGNARLDYLLHGHTHRQRDERVDLAPSPTRIINPGALHRAPALTVATLDPVADRLEFIEIGPERLASAAMRKAGCR